MPTTYAGILLSQNYYGPLKWAKSPCPIQIHVKFRILMGLFKLWWAFWKFWWAQQSLIPIWGKNKHWIWIACIGGTAKNVFNFMSNIKGFSHKMGCRAHPTNISVYSWRNKKDIHALVEVSYLEPCCMWNFVPNITKTRLFKYIENFTSKNWKFSDEKLWYFSYFCSRLRLWVLVRTASTRRF